MGKMMEFQKPLHTATSRDYLGRMMDDKVACMRVAKEFENDYWDGDRRYGYGGYCYNGRWRVVAETMAAHYDLPHDARILDMGCGKAYLLYEFTQVLSNALVTGIDVSRHGLADAKPEIRDRLHYGRAQDLLPNKDNEFDLVISFMTLHNLEMFDLKAALGEIERVGNNAYVSVESYRNEQELFNLQCWALTCEAFHSPTAWKWMFNEFGYTGDYEFLYFT